MIIKGWFFSHQFEEKTEDKAFSRSGGDQAEVRREEPPFHTAARYTHACSCTVRAHTCVHTPACTHKRWTFLCTGIRVALGNTDTRSLHMYHLHIFAQSENRCRHPQISGVLTHICSRTCVGPNDSARQRTHTRLCQSPPGSSGSSHTWSRPTAECVHSDPSSGNAGRFIFIHNKD